MANKLITISSSGTPDYGSLSAAVAAVNAGTYDAQGVSTSISASDDITIQVVDHVEDSGFISMSMGSVKPNSLTVAGNKTCSNGDVTTMATIEATGHFTIQMSSAKPTTGYVQFSDIRINMAGYRNTANGKAIMYAVGSNTCMRANNIVIDGASPSNFNATGFRFAHTSTSYPSIVTNCGVINTTSGTGNYEMRSFWCNTTNQNLRVTLNNCFAIQNSYHTSVGFIIGSSHANQVITYRNCLAIDNAGSDFDISGKTVTPVTYANGSSDTTAPDYSATPGDYKSLATSEFDSWASPLEDLTLASSSTIHDLGVQGAANGEVDTLLTLDLNAVNRVTTGSLNDDGLWSLGGVQYSAASPQSVAAGTASSSSLAVNQAVGRTPDVASSSIYILPPIGLSSPAGAATSTASAIGPLSVLSVSVAESTAYIMPPVGLSSPAGVAIAQSSVQSPGVPGTVTAGGVTTEDSQGSGSFTAYRCLGCEAVETSAGLGPFLVSFSPSCQATESSAGSGTFVAGDIGPVEITHTLSPASLEVEGETGPWSIQDIVLSPASSSAEIDVQVQADIEVSLQPLQSSSEASVDEVDISQQLPSLQSAVSATVDVTAQQSPVLPSLQLAVSLQDLASISTQSSHQLQPVRIAATVFSTINAVSISQLLPNMGQSLGIAGPAESRHPRVYEIPKISRTLKIRNYDME